MAETQLESSTINFPAGNGGSGTLARLYEDGFSAAEKSKIAKNKNEYEEACELLKEAVQCFIEASGLEQDARKVELLRSKMIDFVQDISDLKTLAAAQRGTGRSEKPAAKRDRGGGGEVFEKCCPCR